MAPPIAYKALLAKFQDALDGKHIKQAQATVARLHKELPDRKKLRNKPE